MPIFFLHLWQEPCTNSALSSRYLCCGQICCWRPTLSSIGWSSAGRTLVFQPCSGCWHWWRGARSKVQLYLGSTECTGRRTPSAKGLHTKGNSRPSLLCCEIQSHWSDFSDHAGSSSPHPSVPKGATRAQVTDLPRDLVNGRNKSRTWENWLLLPCSFHYITQPLIIGRQWHESCGISGPRWFGKTPSASEHPEKSHLV